MLSRKAVVVVVVVGWTLAVLSISEALAQGASEVINDYSSTQVLAMFGTALFLAVTLARIIERLIERLMPEREPQWLAAFRQENLEHQAVLVSLMKEVLTTQRLEDDAHRQITERLKEVADINRETLKQMYSIGAVLKAMAQHE